MSIDAVPFLIMARSWICRALFSAGVSFVKRTSISSGGAPGAGCGVRPGDLAGAVPFNLPPGATMNLGDLKLRKRDLLSLTAKVVGGACAKGQSYDADLMEPAV